ncbi:TetR/AcrR family transcriptional regulator [Methylobacterium sp. E-065]|uniref:TetR/AcrR family transcriptional regulator n=1 Tax=Methylobacterium sp. E-065 TaxID=2836583 RepID=UPI001FB9433E|nr:TetR/AcrR family transcriptional regulator [Methylobacterium sp. E-065]MCJ2021899.1 TetR/AcrR family transcriptional regulator [Methylobacterium sp. E-065]
MDALIVRERRDLSDGREVKGAAMRARLRTATEELIAEVGVAATSAAAIAQRCGVSRGAMLHHYPTRDELIIDTAAHFWQRQRETVAALAEDLSAGRTNVGTFVGRLYDEVFRANALVTMLDLMVSGRIDTRVGEAVNRILADLFHSYGDLGERAFAAEDLAPERIRTLVTLIVSTLRGLRIQDNIDRDETRVRAVLAMLGEAVEALLERDRRTPDVRRVRPARARSGVRT